MASRPDRIDPEAAQEFLESGRAVLADARPRAAYLTAEETVPGAIRLDPDAGALTDEELLHLPRELLLIAFCDEPAHAASAEVARRARELGRGDASVLEGGLSGWKAAGLPTVRILREAPTERALESWSIPDLERLAHLALWLGIVDGKLPDAREGRARLERFLAPAPRELLQRYRAFQLVAPRISIPEEHVKRVANLPPRVRERAEALFGRAVALSDDAEGLAAKLSPDESQLLLRWFTWTGEIPRAHAWWYVEPTIPF
jgi:rhodanese-related sulfurtransferase